MVDLNRSKFDGFQSPVCRYLELCLHGNSERVHGALVVANRSIVDIESQLEAFEADDPALSVFYQLVVKVDCLIGAAECLYRELLFSGNKANLRKCLDGEWGADLGSIQHFRMLRSLAIAHPLETDRYPYLGVGKEDGVWCEDVLPRSSLRGDEGDYVLVLLKPENAFGERLQVSIRKDFVVPANCALDALERLGEALSRKLQRKIAELSGTLLRARLEMSTQSYLVALKQDLAERYPSKIERIVYDDGFVYERSIIDSAEQLLSVSFADECAAAAYEGYRNALREALNWFADALQKMSLEEGRATEGGAGAAPNAEDTLRAVIHPSCSRIVSLCSIDNAHYCFEKILSYLASSEDRSIESARLKLIEFDYSGCMVGDACSNAEWGVIQLLRVQDAIQQYFPLVTDASDAELYCQVCAAAYYSNGEGRSKP